MINEYDFERYASVSISMNLLLPQDYVAMAGTDLISDLATAVATGKLPVQMNISLATAGNPSGVPQAIRDMWLARIAEDEGRVKAVSILATKLDTDEEDKLTHAFLVWPVGTPVGDVEAWIESV